MTSEYDFNFDQPVDAPMELVPTTHCGKQPLPEDVRDKVAVFAVHDGGRIPRRFRFREDGRAIVDPKGLQQRYIEMRDWGANVVAKHLAAALGVQHYGTCRVARVLLDFNRFPGSTPDDGSDPLEALAISGLYASALTHREKTALLEDYYDRISRTMEQIVDGKLIGISVHTYDETHASQNKRAHVSLVTRPLSYQRHAKLPYGVFDPMYPDHLAESACSRILRDRISLNLERDGYRVIHNHPYALPDGSIEVRAQVWHFFCYLKQHFEAHHPEAVGDPAYAKVWTMLQDTNLRLAEAEALRSFLHRFRRIAEEHRTGLLAALDAYQHVRAYVRESNVVADYRRSPTRPSSLGIEVRKDLLCTFDPTTGHPRKPTARQRDTAKRIAEAIAGAIRIYFDTDRTFYGSRSRPGAVDPKR